MKFRPGTNVNPFIGLAVIVAFIAACLGVASLLDLSGVAPTPITAFDSLAFGPPTIDRERFKAAAYTWDPETNERFTKQLYKNYEGISTLHFTLRGYWSKDVKEKDFSPTDATYRVWVDFRNATDYNTTENLVGECRPFPGRIRMDYVRDGNRYSCVVSEGSVRVVDYRAPSPLVKVYPQSEFYPQLAVVDAIFCNHFRFSVQDDEVIAFSRGCDAFLEGENFRMTSVDSARSLYVPGQPRMFHEFRRYAEFSSGFFFPEEVHTTLYPGHGEKSGREMRFRVEDVVLNEPIDEEVFQLP